MSYTLEKLEKVALYISTLSDNWLSSQLVQNKYLQPEIIQFIAAEKFNTFDSKLKTSLLLATLSTSKRLISDSFTLAALSLSKVALQDPDETVRIAAVLVDSYINNQTVLDFDRITAQFPLLNELTDQYNKSKAQLPFASYVALLNKDLVTYTKQEPKKFTLNFRNKEPVESRLQKYIDSESESTKTTPEISLIPSFARPRASIAPPSKAAPKVPPKARLTFQEAKALREKSAAEKSGGIMLLAVHDLEGVVKDAESDIQKIKDEKEKKKNDKIKAEEERKAKRVKEAEERKKRLEDKKESRKRSSIDAESPVVKSRDSIDEANPKKLARKGTSDDRASGVITSPISATITSPTITSPKPLFSPNTSRLSPEPMQIDDTAKKEVEDPDTDTEFPNIFKETNQLTADQKEEIKKFMRGQYQMEEGKIVNIIMNQVESTFEGNPVFVRVNMELNFQACRWRKTTSRVRIR